jgi:hypothetical protein
MPPRKAKTKRQLTEVMSDDESSSSRRPPKKSKVTPATDDATESDDGSQATPPKARKAGKNDPLWVKDQLWEAELLAKHPTLVDDDFKVQAKNILSEYSPLLSSATF